MNTHSGLIVRYVKGDGEIVEARITKPQPPLHAYLEWQDGHTALARYSTSGEPNTFHLTDEGDAAVPAVVERPKPFRPGAKAEPEKQPKPTARERPHKK